MKYKELEARLLSFTTECFDESSRQAESAVTIMGQVLDNLLQDAGRVSKVSDETLQAVKSVREAVQKQSSTEPTSAALTNVVSLLKKISNEHAE